MLLHSELQGTHDAYGPAMTIQEMLDLLRSIPRQARQNYLSMVDKDGNIVDVTGLHFAQSDQAEKWEFKVYVVTSNSKE
jgi:hypothetical protein